MNVFLPGAPEGHHTAASLLADAIRDALEAAPVGTGLGDGRTLDDVVGGAGAQDVYQASAAFLSDWRTDPFDA